MLVVEHANACGVGGGSGARRIAALLGKSVVEGVFSSQARRPYHVVMKVLDIGYCIVRVFRSRDTSLQTYC